MGEGGRRAAKEEMPKREKKSAEQHCKAAPSSLSFIRPRGGWGVAPRTALWASSAEAAASAAGFSAPQSAFAPRSVLPVAAGLSARRPLPPPLHRAQRGNARRLRLCVRVLIARLPCGRCAPRAS